MRSDILKVNYNYLRNILKYYTIILFTTITVLISSCGDQNEDQSDYSNDPFRKSLFNPFFVDQFFSVPNSSGSIWIDKHIKLLDINKISIIMKGGNTPDNILEKFVYKFNEKGQNDTFQYYFYGNSTSVVNETHFSYKDYLHKIDVIKYYGIGNLPPVFVYKNKMKTVFYKPKSNNKNDSLFYYPNPINPKVIIDKIGSFNNYVEIIVPKGSSSTEILKQISKVDSDLTHFELSEKMLTYTKDNLPVESYYLGENWNQLELAKQWEYNKYKQVIHFKQWMHNTLIKNIDILYNENSLPKRIVYNRKKYYLIYKKI